MSASAPTVDADDPEIPANGEFRRYWGILFACTLALAVAPHVVFAYTAGIFFVPLQREFGWTSTQVSFSVTIMSSIFAVTSPFVGNLIDRYGERVPIVASLAMLSLWLVMMSTLSGSIHQYWFYAVLTALCCCGATTLPLSRPVSIHFVRNRGLALAIALCGTGFMAAVGPGLFGWVTAVWGWRVGYLAMAAMVAAATPLVAIPLQRAWRKERMRSAKPVIAAAQASWGAVMAVILRRREFWLMVLAFPGITFAGTGFIVHMVPFLTHDGMPLGEAARLSGLIGLFMMGARLVVGFLVDRMFAPKVAAAMMLFCAIGFLLTAMLGSQVAWLTAACVGLAIGAELDLTAYMISRYFPLSAFGRTYGLLYSMIVFASGLAPVVFGYVYDVNGSYIYALYGSSMLFGLAAASFALMPAYPASEKADPGRAAPQDAASA